MNKVAAAVAGHRHAADAYLTRARSLDESQWVAPIAPGKWSPAEISEHLRLTYKVVGGEVATGAGGLRPRVPTLLRPLIRFRFLRRILRDRKLPEGAKASREISPSGGPFEQAATLAGLSDAVDEFEGAASKRIETKGLAFNHHVFGTLRGADALNFVAIHFEHHTRQLPGSG